MENRISAIVEEFFKTFDDENLWKDETGETAFVPIGNLEYWLTTKLTELEAEKEKAVEALLQEMEDFTFDACPYEGTMMRAFIRSKRSPTNS